MHKQYHILNGDALKAQFPKKLSGELIIARECLVDGNVHGSDLEELFGARAQFISTHYEGYTEQDYYKNGVTEFKKVQNIQGPADINLWFEDDLFCQVNFWFVVYLLHQSGQENSIFLVRPPKHTPYGFGGLDESELNFIYEQRVLLTEIPEIASLWSSYQTGNIQQLLNTAKALKEQYPFILPAVQAHMDRIPNGENLGRPKQALLRIMGKLKTQEFGPIFRAFNQEESIYGFGDLQVKRLLDELKGQSKSNL